MTYFSPSSSARNGGRKDGTEDPAGEPRRIGTQPGGSRGRSRQPAGPVEPTGPAAARQAYRSAADSPSEQHLTDPTAEALSAPGAEGLSGSGAEGLSGPGAEGLSAPGAEGLSGPGAEGLSGPGAEALAARGPGAAEPPRGEPVDPAASRRAVPPASRPGPSASYRPDEPPGDLAGLFPSREPRRPDPDEPRVIDLTYQERPAVASDDPQHPQHPQPELEHAVPGFPVDLPQPSLRREQLLLTAVSWLIVLFTTLLGALGGLTYSSVKSATFTATSSVIVTPAKGAALQSDPASFANAYAQVALDTPVLGPALADAGISTSVDEARKHLTVSVPSGSALITIQATASSGADAAALANAAANGIATYGTARAPDTGYDVSTFTPATAPTSSSRPDRALNVLVGALIGLAVGVGVVLVIRRSRRASAAAAA